MPKRYLIVEDDPLVSLLLENFLDALEDEVISVAKDVSTALAAVAAGGFDAAIVDVHLANGETSWPVVEALRAARIPFLITTGGAVPTSDLELPESVYLLKPFTLAQLERALSDLA